MSLFPKNLRYTFIFGFISLCRILLPLAIHGRQCAVQCVLQWVLHCHATKPLFTEGQIARAIYYIYRTFRTLCLQKFVWGSFAKEWSGLFGRESRKLPNGSRSLPSRSCYVADRQQSERGGKKAREKEKKEKLASERERARCPIANWINSVLQACQRP